MCARARARVCVCVCVCVRARARVRVRACVRVCVHRARAISVEHEGARYQPCTALLHGVVTKRTGPPARNDCVPEVRVREFDEDGGGVLQVDVRALGHGVRALGQGAPGTQ